MAPYAPFDVIAWPGFCSKIALTAMLGSPYYTGGMFKTTNNTEGFIFLPSNEQGGSFESRRRQKKTEAPRLETKP